MDLVLDAWVQMIATARAAGVPVTLQDLVSRFDGTDFVILPTYYSAETGARLSPPGKEAPKAATISQAAALSLTATFSSSFWVPVVCNQNPTNGHPARFQVPGSLAWGKSTPPGTGYEFGGESTRFLRRGTWEFG